ncbi:MAG TPA: diaminopimelate decarboxylase [Burkholderiaceae bacterium]|nr:diaminopimelate decarboxylase [Burkholderiaceae bacterium]
MESLSRIDGSLQLERVALERIAGEFGTPVYVYSRAAIERAYGEFADAARGRRVTICYALKANSNLSVIRLLADLGAGFDIVSAGELERVIAAGGDPTRVVFSGVGKQAAEMRRALEVGVRCFNVESESELRRLDAVAADAGTVAPVSLRVNPDVDAGTHPYISTGLRQNKFGIAHASAIDAYRLAASLPHLRVDGIDCHIGSQITEIAPFLAALDRVLELVDALRAEGIALRHIDLGGGLGIRYRDESPPPRDAMMRALFERIERWSAGAAPPELMFEFGRSLVGNAGLLLTRVEYLKRNLERRFAIVDAAMNDLLRPTLYDAYHDIVPVRMRAAPAHDYDVVGPVCETGDWLGRQRRLAIAEGDLLAILSAGAYGMVMASNYNTRVRPAEVLVDGDTCQLIRERERIGELFAHERVVTRRGSGR